MRMLPAMMVFVALSPLAIGCKSQRQKAQEALLQRFRESPIFWTDGTSTFSEDLASVKLFSVDAERAGVDLFALYQKATWPTEIKLQLAYCLIALENKGYVHAVEQDIAARLLNDEFLLWTMVLMDCADAGGLARATLSEEYASNMLRVLCHVDAPYVHLLFAARSLRENDIRGAMDSIILGGSSSPIWQSRCWELLQQMPAADVTEYLLSRLDAQDGEGIYAAGLLIEMDTQYRGLVEKYLSSIISGNNPAMKKAAEAEILRLRKRHTDYHTTGTAASRQSQETERKKRGRERMALP